MGSLDIPPPHTPGWVVPLHSGCLSVAFLLWSLTYVLMTRRSLATKSYGMPLLALACNVSWEIVNLFYVCEMPLEKVGLAMWLVLDVGLVYTTVRFGPDEWRASSPSSSPSSSSLTSSLSAWAGRNIGCVLALLTAAGCVAHWRFSAWWLAAPGRSWDPHASKAGKWWGGQEGFDTSELAFWTSGFAQLIASYGSLSMLRSRGHSGGTGYDIWFCRAAGTVIGPILGYIPMWWYWPEAHGYVASWLSVLIWGPGVVCDLIYPIALRRVRSSELVLPDGRVISGPSRAGDDKKTD
ncbi:hypothetical protein VTK26DRAFT_8752 [Humicola hyalothermophila]